MKRLLRARYEVGHLVKLVNAGRNRLDLSAVQRAVVDETSADKVPDVVPVVFKATCVDPESFYCRGFAISADGKLKVSLKNKVGSEIDVTTPECSPTHLAISGDEAYTTCVFALSPDTAGRHFKQVFTITYTDSSGSHSEPLEVAGVYGRS